MTLFLNTSDVAEADRAEMVRQAIATAIVPVEIGWPVGRVTARGMITDLGELTAGTMRSSATTAERTPAQARDALEPSIFLSIQRVGSSLVAQDDREAVVRAGTLVIYDSTAPYALVDDNGLSQEFFRVPHAALAMPHDMIRKACAVALSPGHPLTALTTDYLSRLASTPELLTAADAAAVGYPSIELIRAVIATHFGADALGADALQATLPTRILEYVRRHLGDPGLCAEQVAAAHYISVRHLYKVLADSGIGLSNWIRTRRLEACRHELTRASAATTIAAVARKYGFSDMSSFSRAFRAEYGTTPRQWRGQRAGQAVLHRIDCADGPSAAVHVDPVRFTPRPLLRTVSG
jgi:AraC-like DNA-binding protein